MRRAPCRARIPFSMKVITIYGSKSDLPFMEPAREYLKENNVEHEEVVYSAHRDLPELIEYLKKLEADLAYNEGFLQSVMKKLSNEKFVSKAPAAVIEMERKKQADAESKIAALKESIAALKK